MSTQAHGRVVMRDRITGCAAGVAAVLLTAGLAWGATTERVSVNSTGQQGDGFAGIPASSADGRYMAFTSGATDLVPGDTNGLQDIFVHDRQTGATELVSVAPSGAPGDDTSYGPDISADGRYVVFGSNATNLVPGDTNGVSDVFVRDLVAGTTQRVSVLSGGGQGGGGGLSPAISADGRYVAFDGASDLVPGESNGINIFVHNRVTGVTERLIQGAIAGPNDSSAVQGISADGTLVLFHSSVSNLVPGDTGGTNVFVADRTSGTVEQVSVDSAGVSIGGLKADISADGRYVVFTSAGGLFERDRATGVTAQVTASFSGDPAISGDGRYVAFNSSAANLVAGDTNGVGDVFLQDRLTGLTERVSLGDLGQQADGEPFFEPALNDDGRYVAFGSSATNLVPGDTNGVPDVFVRDRGAPADSDGDGLSNDDEFYIYGTDPFDADTDGDGYTDGDEVAAGSDPNDPESVPVGVAVVWTDLVGVSVSGNNLTKTGATGWGNGGAASVQSIAGDGGVSFTATETNTSRMLGLSAANANAHFNTIAYAIFARAGGEVRVFENGANRGTYGTYQAGDLLGVERVGTAIHYTLNGAVVYTSTVPSSGALIADAALYHSGATITDARIVTTPAGTPPTERVSVDSAGHEANVGGLFPAISDDGRYVTFTSLADNLVPGDTNGALDIFRHDRETGATERVSVSGAGTQANGASSGSAVNADGRYVAFASDASDLIAGDTNGTTDVFVRDLVAGTTERVSVDSAGGEGNGGSGGSPDISADGRYVAFVSSASDLVAADTNGVEDIFVHDRVTGVTERVSVSSAGVEGNGTSFQLGVSDDGRYVAFDSDASNLVPGDTNGAGDIFVHDRQTGVTERVSVDSAGAQLSGTSYNPDISADGRYVVFTSDGGLFERDRVTGVTALVTATFSGNPAISGDGRYVAFSSGASNLVAGDTNGVEDVFVYDRLTAFTERVSIGDVGQQGDNASLFLPAVSFDARYVAFTSLATNLVPGDTNGAADVFVRDRETAPVVPITWTDLVGVSANGNSLTKTAGTAWGNAGAASLQSIAGDGGVSFTATETNTSRMLGLSAANANAHFNTIAYAIFARAGGEVRVFENGTNKGTYGTYQSGDVLGVQRSGTAIHYTLNGAVVYTSTVASSGSLIADAALYHAGATITDAAIRAAP